MESRHLITEASRHISKDVARQLHAVAGIARESDNNLVESFYIGILQHSNGCKVPQGIVLRYCLFMVGLELKYRCKDKHNN